MERTIRRIGLVGVLPLTITAVIGGGALIAFADGESPADPGASSPFARWPFLANQDEPGAGTSIGSVFIHGTAGHYLEKLAEKLGVSEEQLREAIKQTSLDLLDEAVANGEISEEAATKFREAIENGEPALPFGGGFVFPGGLPGIGALGEIERHLGPSLFGLPLGDNSELSSFLGVTEEQLRDELNAGKTLAEVGEAHGKSRAEVKDFLIGQHESMLTEAVSAGKLTDAEADKVRAEFAEHVDRMLDAEIRIHLGEDDPPPGLEGGFDRWRSGGAGPFPGPGKSPPSGSSNQGKTY